MARLIGMGLTAYQALERGDDDNPRFRFLVNAATILGVPVEEVIENDWRRLYPSPAAPETPSRETVWHTVPSSPVPQDRANLPRLSQRQELERMAKEGRKRS